MPASSTRRLLAAEATASRAASRRRRVRRERCVRPAPRGRRAGALERGARAPASARRREPSPRARRVARLRGSGAGGWRPRRAGAPQARDRRLDRRDLAEVDEAGQRADRACKEGRPGAWRPDDEHEAVVEPAEALAERGATSGREALGHTEVVRGRLENAVHRRDSRRRHPAGSPRRMLPPPNREEVVCHTCWWPTGSSRKSSTRSPFGGSPTVRRLARSQPTSGRCRAYSPTPQVRPERVPCRRRLGLARLARELRGNADPDSPRHRGRGRSGDLRSAHLCIRLTR